MKRLIVALLLSLSGCGVSSDPIPAIDNKVELERIGKSLDDDDRNLFIGYMMRRTMAGAFGRNEAFTEKTIGEALTAQKSWAESLSDTQKKQEALKAEVGAKRQAAASQISQSLIVSAVGQKFIPSDFRSGSYQDQEEITFAIKNLSTRDIKAVKGSAIWKDSFGEDYIRAEARFEQGIKAGETKTVKLYWEVNKFIDEQMKWTQLDGSQKFVFEADHVVFSDGSTIQAPDAVE